MKALRVKTLCRLVAVLALAVLLAAPSSAAALSPLLAQVSGQRAYQHVLALAQTIGPHVAGAPEDRTSAAYIADQIAHHGYAVDWQAFSFPFFAVRAVHLTVPSAPTFDWQPRAMYFSPSTPAGGLTAGVVEGGLGRPDDFTRTAVSGKIALIERGSLRFREKAENAAAAGAVAAIIYNTQPGELIGTLVQPARIPVVSLSGEDGQKLLGLVRARAVAVHLDVQTANEQRTTWNIIGTKPGSRDPHRVLVVGAHRDTVAAAPGANDNSSGVAVALEVAEILQAVSLGTTVRFVFFGAEEEGLFGSDYYVSHAGDGSIIGMVNLDMEGVGTRLEVATFRGSDVLARAAARIAAELRIPVSVTREDGSDHVNFERIGVPVVFLFRPDDPEYDTPRDTVDRVNPALLEVSARLALAVVLDTAGVGR
jgi:aminopeptidase YwaD